MADIHLVDSESAKGCLRVALQARGLADDVFCIQDSLSYGPLADGRERMRFWYSLYECIEEPSVEAIDQASVLGREEQADSFAPWRALQSAVALMGAESLRVLIWDSGSGSDYVFLRMACHWLAPTGAQLWQVPVKPFRGVHAVAAHSPQSLAGFIADAVPLKWVEAMVLAEEFLTIAARTELLRECDARGRLQFKPISAHDDIILECCSSQWKPVIRVIGNVMERTDSRNCLGDAFIAFRIRQLIAAGRIESDGPTRYIRHYLIRRVSPCSALVKEQE
ncbi:DUF3658 domain-containing protein [Pseudomonas chlororaphis]|uniref:DUF3658 domain-containing protein n=1 Tax=Pseudomonas chlororaphis TaxID=587753 RepID=UPI000F589A8C|nr:DUF3658 domain-containing protein [Pseudomonas chlororaphis]AZD74464.1 hypothetical protein C4K16_4112 [Pseudomonas chlororaphis subsp. aurantiaca]